MCHHAHVDVTPEMLASIPPNRLSVPRSDFGRLWQHAEDLGGRLTPPAGPDFYLIGVIHTCRWLYGGPVPNHRRQLVVPDAPFTHHRVAADPEMIDLEHVRAASVRSDSHPTTLDTARGVTATLGWACQGTRRPPLLEPEAEAATG